MDRELLTLYRTAKREHWTKDMFLRSAAQIGESMSLLCMRLPTMTMGTIAAITRKNLPQL